MSEYDDPQTAHDAHSKTKKKDAVEPKDHGRSTPKPKGVDSTAVGQALGHLIKAGDSLSALETITANMLRKAQTEKGAEAAVLEMRQLLLPHRETANEELDATWQVLSHNTGMEADRRHVSYEEIKTETLAHPNMGHVAQKVTLTLARVVSNLDGLADKLPDHSQAFQSVSGPLIGSLRHVSANLGLEARGYDDLRKMVELTVHVSAYALQTGLPRDHIIEAVVQMSDAWTATLEAMMHALPALIDVVTRDSFHKAESGLMDKLWEYGEKLIDRFAETVSGVTWATELASAAINKIAAYRDDLEKQRAASDMDAFITSVQMEIGDMESGRKDPKSAPHIHTLASKVDAEFEALGQGNPDAWKFGDHTVIGKQADFLKSLVKNANEMTNAVPSTKEFLGNFLTAFVNANFKERENPMKRSPLAAPTHQDGYVGLRLTLTSFTSGWGISGDTATLHCPNSGRVAPNLMASIERFSLAKLNTNVFIDIDVSDASRDDLPPFWRDERVHRVELDANHSVVSHSTKAHWDWVQTHTHKTGDTILDEVTKLEGE